MTKAVQSVDVRASIVETFRRDLIGPKPGPEDADIAKERLNENPSRWYLAGFLAPAEDEMAMNAPEEDDDPGAQEERENQTDLVEEAGADLAANGRRRYAFDDGKAGDVTPIRFVCACEKGHLQDIDWRRVVHGPDRCQEPMWVEESPSAVRRSCVGCANIVAFFARVLMRRVEGAGQPTIAPSRCPRLSGSSHARGCCRDGAESRRPPGERRPRARCKPCRDRWTASTHRSTICGGAPRAQLPSAMSRFDCD
jgi:hypothetical protein